MFIQIILILLLLYKLCFFSTQTELKNIPDKIVPSNLPSFRQLNNHFHFEFIGNLYNKEKNIMLKLYGRERIRRVWDYFIIYSNHSIETKIDVSSHKEKLEHLDSVYIEIFQTEFILYKNENKYKYYPYIFSA